MTTLCNWHGHDGGDYANDADLYSALRNGSYKGQSHCKMHEAASLAGVRGDGLFVKTRVSSAVLRDPLLKTRWPSLASS